MNERDNALKKHHRNVPYAAIACTTNTHRKLTLVCGDWVWI